MPTVMKRVEDAKAAGVVPRTATAEAEPELMTVGEVAAWLKLSVKGIYNLVETRRIPHLKVSSRLRFLPSEIQAWLEESRVPLRRTS